MICQRINKKVMRKTLLGGRQLAWRPFQNLEVDFTELPPVQKLKYLLVLIDHLTHWLEAFPTTRATAEVVSKTLHEQIILKYGIVTTVDSDRGQHFTAEVLTRWLKHWKLHGNSTPHRGPKALGE